LEYFLLEQQLRISPCSHLCLFVVIYCLRKDSAPKRAPVPCSVLEFPHLTRN
jgi:hypothetical protein